MKKPDTQTILQWRNLITETFTVEELKDLCFMLGERYDDIEGDTVSSKARELITYMVRRGRFEALVAAVHQVRPHLRAPHGTPGASSSSPDSHMSGAHSTPTTNNQASNYGAQGVFHGPVYFNLPETESQQQVPKARQSQLNQDTPDKSDAS